MVYAWKPFPSHALNMGINSGKIPLNFGVCAGMHICGLD
jgi:hypothetical protein